MQAELRLPWRTLCEPAATLEQTAFVSLSCMWSTVVASALMDDHVELPRQPVDPVMGLPGWRGPAAVIQPPNLEGDWLQQAAGSVEMALQGGFEKDCLTYPGGYAH